MAARTLILTETQAGEKLQKSITDINPTINDDVLLNFTKKLNALTTFWKFSRTDMITKAQIKDLLRSFREKFDSRLAGNSNAGLMSAADKTKLDSIQVDFESAPSLSLRAKNFLITPSIGEL